MTNNNPNSAFRTGNIPEGIRSLISTPVYKRAPGECELWIAVICQAVEDAQSPPKRPKNPTAAQRNAWAKKMKTYRSAKRYLVSEGIDQHAGLLGVHPDAVRRLVAKEVKR